ncbi:PASTA domain-containing protein [Granulicella sp. L46]|uniref:PASTA domain-containing protein n=1 Tax=Granulicella sp. L46 TaxID=1641865 RepID=UPI00131C7EE8|nr:PASTA domain-containing protein [Granulicella sp. L46]
MKPFVKWTLLGMAMLAVMLVSAGITLRFALHGHEVTIPDFAGMTVGEASQAALRTGVDLNIENKFYSTTVPAGRVLSQAPAAGSRVRHGWQVRVTESLGPQQVTIPDVVGDPMQESSMEIRKMQLDLGTLAHIGAPGDAEMTLAQTPPPNAGVDQPRVNLLLSSSVNASSAFVLPSFVGMSFGAANRAAIGLGLKVATIGGVPAAAPAPAPAPAPVVPGQPVVPAAPAAPVVPSGVVTEQSPESGFKASRGDVVRLTLGASGAAAAPVAPAAPAAVPVPVAH